MVIGNPLYDTIFKYLMEDTEVAKRLIGILISEDIETLDFTSKEQVKALPTIPLALFRMDFIATIKTVEGRKKVLIEVQKAKKETDISRFRGYLGKQYALKEYPLPIITIYFLGYDLQDIPESVVKVCRKITGLLSGTEFDVKNEFVELLTHDAYLIQVNKLRRPLRTPIEKVLSIFDQSNRLAENYYLDYPDEEIPEEVLPLVKRLQMVTKEKDLREQLELEAELEYEYRMTLGKREQEIKELEQRISKEIQRVAAERQRAEAEKQRAEAEKQRAEAEKQRAETEKQRAETEKQRAETEKQRAEELIRQSVIALSKAGMNLAAIADTLQIPINSVKKILGEKQ